MLQANSFIKNIQVKGQLLENYPLGGDSWFRCGGSADLVFMPADFEDLVSFLKQYPEDAPLMVIGGMANTIVRDGGVRGCVIRLGKALADVALSGDQIMAGAGTLNGTVASMAAKNGLGGLEFLSGIPGSVGGAVCMNAGAYGAEVKDVLVEAGAVDRSGGVHLLTSSHSMSSLRKQGSVRSFSEDPRFHGENTGVHDLRMRYRKADVPCGYVITHAVFQARHEDHALVKERLKEIKKKRNDTQPISEKTGGSTFANPSAEDLRAAGLPEDMRAWQVVEKVGGRGLRIGGAQMSEKHCNFMINTGGATAADLEALGDELIHRAKDQFGLALHWEIKRIGEA